MKFFSEWKSARCVHLITYMTRIYAYTIHYPQKYWRHFWCWFQFARQNSKWIEIKTKYFINNIRLQSKRVTTPHRTAHNTKLKEVTNIKKRYTEISVVSVKCVSCLKWVLCKQNTRSSHKTEYSNRYEKKNSVHRKNIDISKINTHYHLYSSRILALVFRPFALNRLV